MASATLPHDIGEVLVAGRGSYFTPLLEAIHSPVRLGYWDYQARVTFHVTPKDDLTAFAFGAHAGTSSATPPATGSSRRSSTRPSTASTSGGTTTSAAWRTASASP